MVEYASEFRYRDPVIYPDDVAWFISQSGETSYPIATLTFSTSAPSFSQRFAISFIKDILIARNAFAVYDVIERQKKLIVEKIKKHFNGRLKD